MDMTTVYVTIGLMIFTFVLGWAIGKEGIAGIENDIANIKLDVANVKGQISGTKTTTALPTKTTVVTPVAGGGLTAPTEVISTSGI